MELFKNKTINLLYRLYIILNKFRTKQTRPNTFFKIVAYALKLPLIIYHAKTTMSRYVITCTHKVTLYRIYIIIYICKLINSFLLSKIVSFILNCLFFIQNKIQVIIPMTLRENAISVCCCFLLKAILITIKS